MRAFVRGSRRYLLLPLLSLRLCDGRFSNSDCYEFVTLLSSSGAGARNPGSTVMDQRNVPGMSGGSRIKLGAVCKSSQEPLRLYRLPSTSTLLSELHLGACHGMHCRP